MKSTVVSIVVSFMFFTRGCHFEKTDNILEGLPCECQLDIDKLKQIHYNPMYLYSKNKEIIYPTNDNQVTLATGQDIEIHCTNPSGLFVGKNKRAYKIQKLELRCLYQWKFATMGKVVDIRHIGCKERVSSTPKLTKIECGLYGRLIQVGYYLVDGTFLIQYSVCFNFKYQIPQYTTSTVAPVYQNNYCFTRKRNLATFYNLSVGIFRYYHPETMRHTINKQIGRLPNDTWIIDENRNMILGRGHLVPTADYYYEYQKRSTHYYINIVPQWVHFNSISWNGIETALRNYAIKKQVELQVYTGTFRLLKLRHINGSYVQIFIADDQQKMPVALHIWKIVYDAKNTAGIAVIGINNFFLRGKYHALCNDISPLLPWMGEKERKYVQACAVDEWVDYLRKVYKGIPDFKVDNILGMELALKNKTKKSKKQDKPFKKFSLKHIISKFFNIFKFKK